MQPLMILRVVYIIKEDIFCGSINYNYNSSEFRSMLDWYSRSEPFDAAYNGALVGAADKYGSI